MGLTNDGRDAICDLIRNVTTVNWGTPYLGVGSSSTPFAATQTNLQGGAGAAVRKAMEAGYPKEGGTANVLQFRSIYGTSDANFAWNEWGVFTVAGTGDPPTGGTMLSRKVESLGSKTNVEVWQLTVELTLTAA